MGILSELAIKYGTDKWGHHYYTEIYHSYFEKRQHDNIVFLEIGIGGYHYPDRGGASLKMWEEYFQNGKIHGIDIHPKTGLDTYRIKTHVGSQDDEVFLNELIDKIGAPDYILDDGCHFNVPTIKAFEILFPKLKSGGIYIIEDAGTSYWEEHNWDGCRDGNNLEAHTSMNYFRKRVNDIHHEFIPEFESHMNLKDSIFGIHFYKDLIIILKK